MTKEERRENFGGLTEEEHKTHLRTVLSEAEYLVRMLKINDEEVTSDWVPLQCEYCGARDGENRDILESATDDGDSPGVRILCLTCTSPIKAYIRSRGYDVDWDELFHTPRCGECEEEGNLLLPISSRGSHRISSDVRCDQCRLGEDD